MGTGLSGHRRSRARRRGRPELRRHVYRLLSNLSLGVLLVGCASPSFPRLARETPKGSPVDVLLADSPSDERIAAYRQLGELDKLSAQEREVGKLRLIVATREEGSPLARTAAVISLSKYDGPDVLEALKESASDRSTMVRVEASKALGLYNDRACMEILGRLATGDSSSDVRYAACEALVSRPNKECNSYLVECLRDRDYSVVQAAHRGLRQNTGTDLGSAQPAWAAYFKGEKVAPQPTSAIADQSGSFMNRLFR